MTTCLPSLQCCVDELHLDTDCIFELVLNDPKFEGLLPSLSNSEALQVMTEVMGEIYNAPAPQVLMQKKLYLVLLSILYVLIAIVYISPCFLLFFGTFGKYQYKYPKMSTDPLPKV